MKLEDLKPGDPVAVVARTFDGVVLCRRERVARVTRAAIFTDTGASYPRCHGRAASGRRLEPWDEARHPSLVAGNRLAIARREIVQDVRSVAPRLSDTAIDEIRRILAAAPNPFEVPS